MEEVSHHHTISMIHSFTFPVLLIVLKRPCNSGLFCQKEKLLSELFRVLILALKYFLALNNDILRKNVCLQYQHDNTDLNPAQVLDLLAGDI